MAQEIITVEQNDPDRFENQVNELLAEGWRIHASHCGFIDSAEYHFCSSWQAILVRGTFKDKREG